MLLGKVPSPWPRPWYGASLANGALATSTKPSCTALLKKVSSGDVSCALRGKTASPQVASIRSRPRRALPVQAARHSLKVRVFHTGCMVGWLRVMSPSTGLLVAPALEAVSLGTEDLSKRRGFVVLTRDGDYQIRCLKGLLGSRTVRQVIHRIGVAQDQHTHFTA